jgi:hypothetical protein
MTYATFEAYLAAQEEADACLEEQAAYEEELYYTELCARLRKHAVIAMRNGESTRARKLMREVRYIKLQLFTLFTSRGFGKK